MTLIHWLRQQGRGAQTTLAAAINALPTDVCAWASGRRQIPPHRAVQIEFATLGALRADRLRPDLQWVRVKAKGWTWAGKPAVDL